MRKVRFVDFIVKFGIGFIYFYFFVVLSEVFRCVFIIREVFLLSRMLRGNVVLFDYVLVINMFDFILRYIFFIKLYWDIVV